MDAGVINFAVYENGSEYLGMASVSMPDMVEKTFSVNGAGIAGDLDIPVTGHRDAMRMTFTFTDNPEGAYRLAEPRRHLIDLRAAHEEYDSVRGAVRTKAYKHILELIPISHAGGEISPANSQGTSVECSVLSRKDFVDGKLMRHFDPVHWVDIGPDGVNRLAEVAKALGK